jgi:4-hydroxy-3-polyprenylbenzoate decarboxylase
MTKERTKERKDKTMSTYTVAISGASGAPYAYRVLHTLIKNGHTIYLCISGDGLSILNDETELKLKGSETDIQFALERHFNVGEGQITYFDEDYMYATIASGSLKVDAMVVIPCSMKTLAAIANGFASNLIERAADVMIKEKRKLVLVPRETPLSAIHLRNMLTLAELGCHIIPAMPAFYHHPKHISDMVDFIAGRVLDSMGVENDLAPRWGI